MSATSSSSRVGIQKLIQELGKFDSRLFILEFSPNRFDNKYLDCKIIKAVDVKSKKLISPRESYNPDVRRFYKCFSNDAKLKFGVFRLVGNSLKYESELTTQVKTEIINGSFGPYIRYTFEGEDEFDKEHSVISLAHFLEEV